MQLIGFTDELVKAIGITHLARKGLNDTLCMNVTLTGFPLMDITLYPNDV